MKRPKSIRGYITAAQWAKLRLSDLEKDEQEIVAEVLVAAFDGEKRTKVPQTEIAFALRIAKDISDGFGERFDASGFTKKVLREAEALVARQRRKK